MRGDIQMNKSSPAAFPNTTDVKTSAEPEPSLAGSESDQQSSRIAALEKELYRHSRVIYQMQLLLEKYAGILERFWGILEQAVLVKDPASSRNRPTGELQQRNRKTH